MTKSVAFAVVLAFVAAGVTAQAQTRTGRSVASDPRAGTLNQGYITRTGETVPNPGASQSAGTTPLDLGVQRRDTQIQNSICTGC